MWKKVEKLLACIGGIVVLAIFGDFIAKLLSLGLSIVQLVICIIFWGAIFLYVINPAVFSSKKDEYAVPAPSYQYLGQTLRHFLFIQMIPGMAVITVSVINKDWVNSESFGYLLFGPFAMLFILSFVSMIISKLTKEKA